VVSDTISAEAMQKSAGSDAAEVVQRAPAVTVKDDKYIFVRGLGERYSSAILNGSRLPSTDPQRRVVPLDLFPASFLESIAILKGYTPDLPGDFSGGLAAISLRDFPETLSYSLGLSTGANTQSTGRDFQTYDADWPDYFGYGEGFRAIPDGVPDDLNPYGILPRTRFGRSFRDIWAIDEIDAPPNAGVNLSVGNSFGPLGVQLGGIYSNQYKRRRNEISDRYTNAGSFGSQLVAPRDAFLYDRSTFQSKLGGLLTSALKLGQNHKLTFRALYNRNGTDEVLDGQGFAFNVPDKLVAQQNLRYTAEELAFGQFGGEHRFPWLHIDWRTAYSRSTQEEPDTRFYTQVSRVTGLDAQPSDFEFTNDSLGGTRLFNDLQERLSDSALDFTVPFLTALPFTNVWLGLPAKFKFGIAWSYRDRDFTQRRFRYRLPQTNLFDLTLPAEELLRPEHLGPDGFSFEEETLPRDNYTVSQEIAASYGMFDLPLVENVLRFVAGVRYEYSYIQLDAFNDEGDPEKIIKNNSDPLPGANLILSPREDMNVRLGYSRSVSRPEFRELSPAFYPAPRGLNGTVGNPFLVQTAIESFDARWEWFFSPLELVSLSVFQKTLNQPIEFTQLPQSSNNVDSFLNADKAELLGVEIEGRKDLGFLSRHLKNVSLLANTTWARSNVTVPRGVVPGTQNVRQIHTSTERALQGQAPFIVNAALDYTHPTWGTVRLLYNTAGARISSVGALGLPDVIEERRDQVDFVLIARLKELLGVPLTAQLNVENITNDNVVLTQGALSKANATGFIANAPGVQSGIYQRYTTGVVFSFGLTYSF
jgi:hypothetical protein